MGASTWLGDYQGRPSTPMYRLFADFVAGYKCSNHIISYHNVSNINIINACFRCLSYLHNFNKVYKSNVIWQVLKFSRNWFSRIAWRNYFTYKYISCKILSNKHKHKYANLAPSFCFVPVAVETLGALGAGAMELLHELGRRITESTGERRAMEYLLQRLSVAIQRGNAASVLGTVGQESADSQKLDAVFYL